jgi:hypothetical protein
MPVFKKVEASFRPESRSMEFANLSDFCSNFRHFVLTDRPFHGRYNSNTQGQA